MPNLGVPELLIILVIVAMLFGVGKLPSVFGAVGKGIKEFRRESSDVETAAKELEAAAASMPPQQAPSVATTAAVTSAAAAAPAPTGSEPVAAPPAAAPAPVEAGVREQVK
jgi:sec-independent protein translocase protein TatA